MQVRGRHLCIEIRLHLFRRFRHFLEVFQELGLEILRQQRCQFVGRLVTNLHLQPLMHLV
jgi:hypothetical protein